jgi:hypothetical protein
MRTRASGLGAAGGGIDSEAATENSIPLAPHALPQHVKAQASDWPAPPSATLGAELCPGGDRHCGGDFLCIDLTLVNPAFQG